MSNTNKLLVIFTLLVSAFVNLRSIFSDEAQSLVNRVNDTNEAIKKNSDDPVRKIRKDEPVKLYRKQPIAQLPPKSKPKSAGCSAPLLSAVTAHKAAFVDADGIQNNKRIKTYYELSTNLDRQSGDFTTELNNKLFQLFQSIEREFNINLKRKVDLNLVYQGSRTGYEDYLLELGRSAQGSIGKYLYPEHISVIEMRSYEQAMQTSIHEAVHAFNQSYWGHTLRFFNEGLAEYFENITVDGTVAPFDFSRLTHQEFPMEIDVLLFSDTDWHGDTQHKLYQNSNALIHFLMSNKQGRNVIWEIMELERKETCLVLSKAIVLDILFETYPNHQQDFDYWFKDGLALFLQSKETK